MPAKISGIRVRSATRHEIPVIVSISNSSVSEVEDLGFGRDRRGRKRLDSFGRSVRPGHSDGESAPV